MHESISMNSARPVPDLKHENKHDLRHDSHTEKIPFTSYNEMSEKYKEQLEKNQNLEKELLKNKIQMKNLEEKLNAKLEKDYTVSLTFIYLIKID